MRMKISIITATYNSAQTLSDTIESVLNQTYQNIEYIIVDGVSSDNTLDIARSYQKEFGGRMRIVSEPDKGIYDALNKGIALATGDVIGFIHADDLLAKSVIVDDIANAFGEINCKILYGDLHYVNHENTKVIRNWKSGLYSKRQLKLGWMPPHPTLYVRRDLYQKIGTFNTQYRISADYDFMLRALNYIDEKDVVYLPKVMVNMRVGGVSNSGFANIRLKMKEDLRALKDNNYKIGLVVLMLKNLSKIRQFILK